MLWDTGKDRAGVRGGRSGRDKHIYRAVLVLAKMAYRLLVQYSKAVKKGDVTSGLARALGGGYWRL